MGNNNVAFRYSNAHSNSSQVAIQNKTFGFQSSCDSRYLHYLTFMTSVTFVTRVTMFRTLWFGVKRPDVCNIVTISSSTIRSWRLTTFNASFQGFISVWRKIHISVTRVTLPYQLMFEIIPWENKLDNMFSLTT